MTSPGLTFGFRVFHPSSASQTRSVGRILWLWTWQGPFLHPPLSQRPPGSGWQRSQRQGLGRGAFPGEGCRQLWDVLGTLPEPFPARRAVPVPCPAAFRAGNPASPQGSGSCWVFTSFAVSRALRRAKLPSSGTEHPCRAAGGCPRAGILPQRELPRRRSCQVTLGMSTEPPTMRHPANCAEIKCPALTPALLLAPNLALFH